MIIKEGDKRWDANQFKSVRSVVKLYGFLYSGEGNGYVRGVKMPYDDDRYQNIDYDQHNPDMEEKEQYDINCNEEDDDLVTEEE